MSSTQSNKTQLKGRLNNVFPISSCLKNYTKQDFNADFFAGILTTILLVPQGIAYAMLAGLPVQVGLYASILPAAVYAVLGTSRTLSVGPVSIAAIMTASVLSAPEVMVLGGAVENAIILAAEGGLILLLMALFRMGGMVNFISHPVLTGFTSGAAILIVLNQMPHLLGLPKNQCAFDSACYNSYFQQINSYTLAIGLLCLSVLIFFGKPLGAILKYFKVKKMVSMSMSKSASLLALIISTGLVTIYQLSEIYNVPIVGPVKAGLPEFSLSFVDDFSQWKALLPSAAFIAIIAYVESVAIAKVTANISKQTIQPNQELIALGGANLISAVSGGMSVAGGFSRTMVNFSAGAKTQIATIITVILLCIAIVFLSDQFTYIPKAGLAAVIIVAIAPLIKFREIISTWRYERSDGMAELITLIGVLALGIEEGIALGVLITVFCYLRRTSRPHIAVVGCISGTEHFRNVNRHQVETWENLVLIRIDENISFANVNYIVNFIEEQLVNNAEIKHVVLIFSSVSHIDKTAFEALENLIATLKSAAITLNLAEVKGPVMDKLKETDFLDELGAGKVFFQTIDAVESLKNS